MPGLGELGWLTLAWAAVVMGLSGFVQGALGFGFPMIATPLLAAVVGFKAAVALVLLPTLSVIVFNSVRTPGFVDTLRRFWMMPFYMIAGAYAGTRLFIVLDPRPLLLLLAVVIIVYLNLERIGRADWAAIRRHPHAFAAVFGLLGGLFEGAVNVAAPPLIIYYLAAGLTPAQLVHGLNICFLNGKSTQLLTMLGEGALTAGQLASTAPFAAVALAVQVWGMAVRDRIDAATYRSWVRRALAVMSLILLGQFAAGFLA